VNGWVKLHRQLKQSAVFDNPKLLKVWVWVLLKASHREHQQVVGRRTVTLQPRQFIFGRYAAAGELNMPPSTVRDYMQILAEMGNVTLKPDTKYTLVSVDNWEVYQSPEEKTDTKSTANGQQMDIKWTSNGHKQEVQEVQEIVLTAAEKNFIQILQGVKGYPLDRARDMELYQALTDRYPDLDILDVAKDWAAYKLDKPLGPKSNPRSQLNTACKKSQEWGKNKRQEQPQPKASTEGYTHQRTNLTDLQEVIRRKTMRGIDTHD